MKYIFAVTWETTGAEDRMGENLVLCTKSNFVGDLATFSIFS
jgi:hypothetical protein